MLTAGSSGLPFMGDLDDLLDTIAQSLGFDWSAKNARKSFIANQLGLGEGIAEAFDRGASGIAGMPIDVSLRMGLGNLIPMTGILLRSNTDRSRDVMELGGAAGSLAKSALDAGGALLKGELTDAGMKMAPLAVQNIAKAAQMWETGEYRNTRDQKVMDVSKVDAILKGVGFQPGEVAKQSALVNDVQRSKQLAINVEAEIVGKWAQGLNDNRPEKVAEARQMLADWNANNDARMKFSMQSVINKVRSMRQTPQERLLKTAPPELRTQLRDRLQQ
jgi:hypothetical protein